MKKILFALLLSLLLIPSIALAADFKDPDTTGNVTIGKDDKVRNLYTAGANVDIRNEIKGDLTVAGGNVNVNANVEKGLLVAGGNISLNNDVGQSARVAGGSIVVNGNITEDLAVAGGTIKITKDSTVNGDLVLVGGQIEIDGKVSGNARISGGTIIINGEIGKDVKIDGVEYLTIGDSAVITGKLSYASNKEASISSKAKLVGGTDFKKVEKEFKAFGLTTSIIVMSILLKLLSLFVTLLLIIYFLPKSTKNFVKRSLDKPLSALWWGTVSSIIIPVVAVFLLISTLGANIAIIAGLLYVAAFIFAMIMSSLLIGSLLTKQMNKTKDYPIDWKVAAIGSLLSMVLSLIPIVGWIILLAFFLIAFGEMVKIAADKVSHQRK